jgi:RNA-directed DNA polymerase
VKLPLADQRAEQFPAHEEGKANAELWEQVWERANLLTALKRVEQNGGAPGVDGMQVEELRAYLREHWLEIREALDEQTYKPSPVRRVEIPKPDGGVRQLGIPTVLDRLLQQAIAQALTPLYLNRCSRTIVTGFDPDEAHIRPSSEPRNTCRKATSGW